MYLGLAVAPATWYNIIYTSKGRINNGRRETDEEEC